MDEVSSFVEWLKLKGYVIAVESNDSESSQDLHECFYVDELIKEFSETKNK